jgi:hypothetical protein
VAEVHNVLAEVSDFADFREIRSDARYRAWLARQ